ncbi:innate immunity activator protein-like [Dromaius novaehollandiae]|uniref:innate immunity activator protein-like n=1 Tax=Dromaius novaehollandiae TaxID=8790 RepID=UPI00311E074C
MEEASDTDSGIMLHSGPDSPVSPVKELPRAARRRQRELEARLEACVQELRRLCLREAELTGTLPREFPLKAGEKPPKVRRRIGAAFKLDETLVLRGADPLSTLERDLALQLQIAKAAHRLSREENISKQLRKRRKTAALKEERKLKELENTLNECRLLAGRRPASGAAEEPGASDASSLSDAALPEEEEEEKSPPAPGTAEAEGRPRSPARPGAWKETGLDRRCQTAGEPRADASRPGEMPPYPFVPVRSLALCRRLGSSAPGTPEPPGRRGQSPAPRHDRRPHIALPDGFPPDFGSGRIHPAPRASSPGVPGCREPAEPRGRSALPRRRPTYYTASVPAAAFAAPAVPGRAGSDGSNSDGSSGSHATSPGSGGSPDASRPGDAQRLGMPAGLRREQDGAPARYQRLVASHSRVVRTPSLRERAPGAGRGLSRAAVSEELRWWHERARLRGARPHSLDRHGVFRVPGRDTCPSRGSQLRPQVPPPHAPKRSPDGAPARLYAPENGEIVTQV